jgi:uncharacterized protein
MPSAKRRASTELFPTDGPVAADRLIGRDSDVEEVGQALLGGVNVIVAAPRRTGKTSVCDAALARAQAEGAYIVALDLFGLSSTAELAEALVTRTIANRSGLAQVLAKARRGARLAAQSVALVTRMQGELGEEIEVAFTPHAADRDPDRYLDYALRLLQRVADADDKRLVLFIDEFQEIANPTHPYGDPEAVAKRMRAILQRSNRVSTLLAGSLEHVMRGLFTARNRALYQFGGFHELRPIDPDAWRHGLGDRFADDDCAIDDAALERTIARGATHPRATMLIAQQTHVASILLQRRQIDLNLVEQGFRAALDRERPGHEQTLERVRRMQRHAFAAAREVAKGGSAYSRLSREAFRALNALRDAGIVERRGRGDWHVVDPLFAAYLARTGPS